MVYFLCDQADGPLLLRERSGSVVRYRYDTSVIMLYGV